MTVNTSLKDIAQSEKIFFQDGDIILMDKMEEIPQICVKVDFFIICICKRGCMQLDLNGVSRRISKHQMMVILPNSSIDNILVSPDAQGGAYCFSSRMVREMFAFNTIMRDIALQIKKKPIYTIIDESEKMGESVTNILQILMSHPENKFFKESMQAMFKMTIYHIFSQIAAESNETNEGDIITRGDMLFHKFMTILEKSNGKERQVNYYADILCVSPKYLSSVCKELTGKTASVWINDITTQCIKKRLLYSADSIKEISNQLDFPNLSFFGRYVKKHLGDSPIAYRKRAANS